MPLFYEELLCIIYMMFFVIAKLNFIGWVRLDGKGLKGLKYDKLELSI